MPPALTGTPEPGSGAPAGKPAPKPGGKLEALTGLRGILALLVVFAHVRFIWGDLLGPAFSEDGAMAMSGFRVPAFFSLSGFVLYLSSAHLPEVRLQRGTWDLLRRRLVRLYPAYAAAIVFPLVIRYAFVLAGKTNPSAVVGYDAGLLLWHIPMLQSWAPRDIMLRLNPPLWMMGYELACSLLLPAALWLVRRAGWWLTLAGIWCLLFFVQPVAAPNPLPDSNPFLPAGLVTAFLFGAATARLARRSDGRDAIRALGAGITVWHLAWLGAAFTGALTVGVFLWGTSKLDALWAETLGQVFSGAATALLCVLFAWSPGMRLARLLQARPLLFLGRISYSLFLFHWPFLMYYGWVVSGLGLSGGIGKAVLALGLVLLVACSNVLYSWLEAPVLRGEGGRKAEPAVAGAPARDASTIPATPTPGGSAT